MQQRLFPGLVSQRVVFPAIVLGLAATLTARAGEPPPAPAPVVEVEEDVYEYAPANNGAGPMWCHGSTCLARSGDRVFATGLETVTNTPPLNNCRWMLFHRAEAGWQRVYLDEAGRTREPSPLALLGLGQVMVSANPTLGAGPEPNGGPARPEFHLFDAAQPSQPPRRVAPEWQGEPAFREHSYRSLAADGPRREMILFQNIGYTHAEWTFREAAGGWAARGQLKWPWGAEYDQPQPIRVCYPNVALKDGAVHFCGVSDIVEPYKAWRAAKKELTGREWDYDFRRLFYTWTPDIRTGKFNEWIEIASRDKTCGWIGPGDLYVDDAGAAHILWTERALDERLRAKFYPEARQSHGLYYAVVSQGKVVRRQTLLISEEGKSGEEAASPRWQVTPEGRRYVIFYVNGRDANGRGLSENRLLEIGADGTPGAMVKVPLRFPLNHYFTASQRGGSAPSRVLDLLGTRASSGQKISYARIRLP
jgi:hypothetical protein